MIANELNYIIKPQQEHHRQAQAVKMYRTAGEGKKGMVKLSYLAKLSPRALVSLSPQNAKCQIVLKITDFLRSCAVVFFSISVGFQ